MYQSETSGSESVLVVDGYVTDCLAYFSSHGLEELSNTQTDEDVHRLPRITPVDPIVSQS